MSRTSFIEAASTLTPEQSKAVRRLKSAITACTKAKVVFHNPLESLACFNGHLVHYIAVEDNRQPDYALDILAVDAEATRLRLPWSGSADDQRMHWVVATSKGRKEYDKSEE